MSMNRYMHSRNIYKTAPDFNELAARYEEFRNLTQTVCIILLFS